MRFVVATAIASHLVGVEPKWYPKAYLKQGMANVTHVAWTGEVAGDSRRLESCPVSVAFAAGDRYALAHLHGCRRTSLSHRSEYQGFRCDIELVVECLDRPVQIVHPGDNSNRLFIV